MNYRGQSCNFYAPEKSVEEIPNGMIFYENFFRNSDYDENDNDFIASDGSIQHSSSGTNNSDSSSALGRFHFLIFCSCTKVQEVQICPISALADLVKELF